MTTATQQSRILITGATGTIGSRLSQLLSAKGICFRALVRNKNKSGVIASLPGAEVVEGDLNDPTALAPVLEGIEKVFLLTNSSEQAEELQINLVKAAREAGVKHIVKLSQLGANEDSPVRFLRYHARVETYIRDSGIGWTFLRPNLFMQGLLAFAPSIKERGKFFAAIGDAKISLVDADDIAAVAAEVLTGSAHEKTTYTITGPQLLSHDDIAQHFSSLLHREVKFIQISPEQMLQALDGLGFPQWQAEGLVEDYAHYSRGEAAEISSAVKDITGESPKTLYSFLSANIPVFKKQ